MTSHRVHPLAAAVTAIIATGSAYAANTPQNSTEVADQTFALEAVTVYGEAYRTTGTKSELKPLEAPMSYEVYDAEVLEQRQADSVNDALRYVPGITADSRSTVTIFDQYTIRGFQSYRNYYDGLVLQYNGLWNLAPQVDMYATESIEVLKGPTSVLYGSAPPGGMINQVAKHPLGQESTQARVRTGSNSLIELGVDHNGIASDNLDYRIVALSRQRDGQMETTEEERKLFAPSATWYITDSTSLNLNLYYQDDPEAVPSTPLPAKGTLSSASYGKLDSDAYAGDKRWGNVDKEVTMVGYKLNHQFSDNVTFLQNFRYTDGELVQQNTYNYGLADADRTLIRSAYFTDEAIEGFTIDNQLAWNLTLGETEHRLLFGIDYQKLDSDIRYGDTLAISTPTLDLGNPDYNQFDPSALPLDSYTEDHDISQKQLGFYAQDEFAWHDLTVIANLRRDSYKSTDRVANTYLGFPYGSTTKIDQDETSGRLAAIYSFSNGWAPYISYATSYEPTSGTDTLTGEAFKPTTAEQYEAGVKFESSNGNTQFTAALFDITQENVVINTSDFLQYTQAGEITSEGLELALTKRLTDNLNLVATYSYQDVEFSKNPLDTSLVGKTPIWVAEKQASLWATYFVNDVLDVSLGVRYIGERQLDAQNTDTLPSETLLDISSSYIIDENFRLALSITNLTDETYVSSCYDSNNCWMGAERNAELSLHMDF